MRSGVSGLRAVNSYRCGRTSEASRGSASNQPAARNAFANCSLDPMNATLILSAEVSPPGFVIVTGWLANQSAKLTHGSDCGRSKDGASSGMSVTFSFISTPAGS